jgi:FAD/FMN-containing dehydrogenase
MTTISIDKLRTDLDGRVIGPDDPGYDEARALFYGGFDKRPAAIVRVASDADAAKVVGLARETGLELAVRSGGHSIPGHSVSEGGIVLDLADMRAIDVDAGERTAWVETGLTAVEVAQAASEHGLAIGFGDAGSVGIGGITLGGGVGYLARKFGLTIDDLLAADIVTADGEIRRVDAETEPDLFWAIRGGGGNFGVATRFHYRLHELPGVVGGMLFLPATTDSIAGFIEAAEAAPEELSTIANVMPAPPMPFVPEEHHGKPVIFGLMCYAGDAEGGERALAPFRDLAQPIADMVKPIAYPEIYPPEEEAYHPIAISHTMYLETAGRAEADTILEHLATSTAMMGVAQLRVLGGAVSRVPSEATAFAHRRNRIMVNVAALYEKVEDRATHETWVRAFAAALHQGDDAAYVNFLGDEGPERIRAAYPGGTWDRLRTIKARYDPTNLFHLNQNIPPAEEGAS